MSETISGVKRFNPKQPALPEYLATPYKKTTKPQLRLKTKQWKKYSPEAKRIAQRDHDVILTDHLTRKEKIHKYSDVKKGLEYFDKGMTKFDKGQKKFWSEWDKGFTQAGFGSKKSKSTIMKQSKGKTKVW